MGREEKDVPALEKWYPVYPVFGFVGILHFLAGTLAKRNRGELQAPYKPENGVDGVQPYERFARAPASVKVLVRLGKQIRENCSIPANPKTG